MARRFFRKAGRRASRFARRAYRAAGKAQMSPITTMAYGAGYGALRPFVSQFTSPLAAKIPVVGQYADEVGMGLLGFAAMKWGSGIVKNMGRTALTVESASIGSQLVSGISNSSAMSTPSQWAI